MKPDVVRCTLAALLLAAPVVPAAAQVTIRRGSRVRLEAPGLLGKRIEGTLIAARGDSITIDLARHRSMSETTLLTIPASVVTKVEMQAGRSRGRGALRGVLIGGAMGLGFAAATNGGRNEGASAGDSVSSGAYAAAGAFIFGGLGAAIGGAIGVERWVRVGPPVRVAFVPSRRGVGLVVGRR